MLTEARGGGVEVALDVTINVGMGIGIGKTVRAAVEGLLFEFEGLAECSDVASFV